ncbi:MAG: M14 family metallopeptidase [Chitinophagaceae bacterium]
MHRKIFAHIFSTIFFVLIAETAFSQLSVKNKLKSPEEFLGYKIGSRFTPHWKVIEYFQHVATNASANVKMEKYGETIEGRPLIMSYVSSSNNIANLENIRKNNLRLAYSLKDKIAADENAPAIVWLSYNVHGNEASSSEAAMLTLFALVDLSNLKTKEWLQHTVVIIDPCLNPDGRDRYINWFNSIAGKNFNPHAIAREHNEPWPGGRTNHYNFDLNRDWVWQTQSESRQRMKMYNQWLPQVHVDYHEQGYNEPYYFAPASEPFHEVITKWQREFQNTIGKNHAKYFDENSWLYFTKERFDLFYPGYGDTYPTFKGAIGMTYEQGGIRAGLGIIDKDGDTLTLTDRAMHHFTTALSTIEIASSNASKLVKEFRKYFNDIMVNGSGEYKTFVIKSSPENFEREESLRELLKKNDIQFETAIGSTRGTVDGLSYQSGKNDFTTIDKGDMLISTQQPNGALARVLFEPHSHFSDSATYDITAWSIPYAYGVKAFASKNKLNYGIASDPLISVTNPETNYGYVFPWKGIQSVKTASQLLQQGILLRFAEQPFEINGTKFDRGTIIVLKTANKSFGNDLWKIVRKVADQNNTQLFPVSTGFVDIGFDLGSSKVHTLRPPRIVLITGEGIGSSAAGEIWHFFDQELNYPVSLVNANDIGKLDWSKTDVLIMPAGNYRFLSDKTAVDNFKSWINIGGRVVALENAVVQLSKTDFGIKIRKFDLGDKKNDSPGYEALKKFEERERDALTETTSGSIFRVEMDNTHPLAFGYSSLYYTLKQDDIVYDFFNKGGWNVGVIKKDNQVAGFVGSRLKDKLKDGLLFGVEEMGQGSVVYLTDNLLFRNFWENGKLMFCNAVFLVGQ